MKTIISILFAFFFILNHGFADGGSAVSASYTQTYFFCRPPYMKEAGQEKLRKLFQPMMSWLEEKSGCKFRFVYGENHEAALTLFIEGRVHFASLGPIPYVVAKERLSSLKILVSELQWNPDRSKKISDYVGFVIARKHNNDISTFMDLKGKRFGFVHKHSTIGYRFPVFLLVSKGYTIDTFFEKSLFLGSHPRVLDALANGSINAGAVYDFPLEQGRKKYGDIFKIIATSPRFPLGTVVAHPNVPDSITQNVKQALLTIPEDRLKGLQSCGYITQTDDAFEGARKLLSSTSED